MELAASQNGRLQLDERSHLLEAPTLTREVGLVWLDNAVEGVAWPAAAVSRERAAPTLPFPFPSRRPDSFGRSVACPLRIVTTSKTVRPSAATQPTAIIKARTLKLGWVRQ